VTIAMLLKKDNVKILPRVRHFVGFPPELSGGSPGQPMPAARVLVIRDDSGSKMLFRYDEQGTFAGDTWHRNLDDAKHQVEFEYGPLASEWVELPEGMTEPKAIADFLLRAAGEN
jgi:hypothetical protein